MVLLMQDYNSQTRLLLEFRSCIDREVVVPFYYMPITHSAKKALRQGSVRKIRNLKQKNKLKDIVKQEKKLIAQKNLEGAKNLLPALYKALDKAAKRGLIKPNTASRRKSRITKFLAKSANPEPQKKPSS